MHPIMIGHITILAPHHMIAPAATATSMDMLVPCVIMVLLPIATQHNAYVQVHYITTHHKHVDHNVKIIQQCLQMDHV